MRLFREDQRAATKEVYARTLTAKSADGESCEILPELTCPENSKTSGVLASIPVKDLFIEDLMGSRPGFRFLMVSCDGINTNQSAIRLLFTELHPRKTLLCLMHVCEAHTINNSAKWGLGYFTYGSLLRFGHAIESVKHWNLLQLVSTKFRSWKDIEVGPELESTAALEYYDAVARQPALEDATLDDAPTTGFYFEHTKNSRIWVQFCRYVCGQKGPFAKLGVTKKADEVARMCNKLWPLGPPSRLDDWYAMEGYTREDYTMTLDALFGRTVPLPIASRWYDSYLPVIVSNIHVY